MDRKIPLGDCQYRTHLSGRSLSSEQSCRRAGLGIYNEILVYFMALVDAATFSVVAWGYSTLSSIGSSSLSLSPDPEPSHSQSWP